MPVWSPFILSDCEVIESVQHRATKLVHSISNLSYEDLLKALDLTTFTERRKRGDMIQLFKIMYGADKFDRCNRFQIVRNQLRGHCFKYFEEIARQQNIFNRAQFTTFSIEQPTFGTLCQINS